MKNDRLTTAKRNTQKQTKRKSNALAREDEQRTVNMKVYQAAMLFGIALALDKKGKRFTIDLIDKMGGAITDELEQITKLRRDDITFTEVQLSKQIFKQFGLNLDAL